MLLRSQLEKRLPVKQGETRLTSRARKAVFVGSYIIPSVITNVEKEPNYRDETKDAYPWKVRITRTYDDGTHAYSGTMSYDANWSPSIVKVTDNELNKPEALRRATRIEKVGRRIKATAVGVALIGTIGAGAYAVLSNPGSEPASATQSPNAIQPCQDIVTGSEALLPIRTEDITRVQSAGGNICKLADTTYRAIK